MDFSLIQILLVFVITFIAAIDQFSFLESFYQPIVIGPIIGAILGDVSTGLIIGGSYQLMMIGNMPVGGAQPPNAVIGGIMATVFAISMKLTDPQQALGLSIPFAVLGQYSVTLIFTLSSGLMAKADQYAQAADAKGIEYLNYLTMGLLGLFFAVVVTLGLVFGSNIGTSLQHILPEFVWKGLGVAGGMMRFVGFAILLKVMISKELWVFYFAGFALAVIVAPAFASQALLLIAMIGLAVAVYDYQTNVKISKLTNSNGGNSDGI